MNFPSRIKILKAKIKELKADAFFSFHRSNYFYLCGFSGSEGALLVTPAASYLFVDSRYFIQAREEAKSVEAVNVKSRSETIEKAAYILRRLKCRSLGFEDFHVSVDSYKKLRVAFDRVRLIPASSLLSDMRSVKDKSEIALIQKAAEIADKVLEKVLKKVDAGVSEKDIATELEYVSRKMGGDKTSFEPIVLSGKRSALPHGRPADEKIKKGELLLIDFGVLYKGYCSDITRTFVVGRPTLKQEKIFELVLRAQSEAIERIKEGVSGREVDDAARKVILKAGLRKHFGHGLGHGLGLNVHERPYLSYTSKDILKSGMALTVEPGVYLKGWGGIRIEDMVLVTDKGCRVLSKFPKKLEA